MKSAFFDDMPKPTLRLSTSFLSQTRNILLPYPFFCRLPTNRHLSKTFHTPAPGKILFLDLRPKKRHAGWKNNSKQLLCRCCYANFCSFGHKSRFCSLSRSLAGFGTRFGKIKGSVHYFHHFLFMISHDFNA